jgi:hypothetical protein
VSELYTTRLATAASLDLRLDDNGSTNFLGSLLSLFWGVCNATG